MTTFDERDKAFENKFAHDKELDFKIQARMTKMLAIWAAAKMGMTDADAKTYAAKMVEADMNTPGVEDVVEMLTADFAKAEVAVSQKEIRSEMQKLFSAAREQIMAGK